MRCSVLHFASSAFYLFQLLVTLRSHGDTPPRSLPVRSRLDVFHLWCLRYGARVHDLVQKAHTSHLLRVAKEQLEVVLELVAVGWGQEGMSSSRFSHHLFRLQESIHPQEEEMVPTPT